MRGDVVTAESTVEKLGRRWTNRRSGGLAVLVPVAALGLAACVGGPSTQAVASLGKSGSHRSGASATTSAGKRGGATSPTTVPKGNATQLLNEWTACMRTHGDPNQADPTVDSGGVIHVDEPAGYFGTIYGPSGEDPGGAGVTCQAYLTDASTALHGGRPLSAPNVATVDRFAACMRSNGVPNFPDPGGSKAATAANPGPSGPPNPDSPAFQKASAICAKKTGVKGFGLRSLLTGEIEIYLATGQVAFVVIGTT